MMEEVSKQVFRRKKEGLMWHFRKDCTGYPRVFGYITKRLSLPLGFQMICAICKRLEKAERQAQSDAA